MPVDETPGGRKPRREEDGSVDYGGGNVRDAETKKMRKVRKPRPDELTRALASDPSFPKRPRRRVRPAGPGSSNDKLGANDRAQLSFRAKLKKGI